MSYFASSADEGIRRGDVAALLHVVDGMQRLVEWPHACCFVCMVASLSKCGNAPTSVHYTGSAGQHVGWMGGNALAYGSLPAANLMSAQTSHLGT